MSLLLTIGWFVLGLASCYGVARWHPRAHRLDPYDWLLTCLFWPLAVLTGLVVWVVGCGTRHRTPE
jgi:hypothetical protein